MRTLTTLFILAFAFHSVLAQNMGIDETIAYINKKLVDNPEVIGGQVPFKDQVSVENNALVIIHSAFGGGPNHPTLKIDKYSIPIMQLGECTSPETIGLPEGSMGSRGFVTINCSALCSTCKDLQSCVSIDYYTDGSYGLEGDALVNYKVYGRTSGANAYHFGLSSKEESELEEDMKHSIGVFFDNSQFIQQNLFNAFQHLIFLLKKSYQEKRENTKRQNDANDPFARPIGHIDSSVAFAPLSTTSSTTATAKTMANTIQMVNRNGVYQVPVVINGSLKINFILDSGASDVSVSPDVALTLTRTGTVTDADFIGTNTYRFADGSTAKSSVFNLKEIKIGSKTITNVRASISNSIDAPLLLGQSLLNRLGKVTFDYTNNVIVIQN